MNATPADIERIVCEVVRRLSAATPPAAAPACPDRSLSLPDRLVTLATLAGRLGGVERVQVARRAIITPAVRDELKKRNIRLERGDAIPAACGRLDLLVGLQGQGLARDRWLPPLAAAGTVELVEAHGSACPRVVAAELAQHVAARRVPGLLITDQPYAAAAAAAPAIATALVARPADVARAQREIAARLFVVAADEMRMYHLARLASAVAACRC